MTNRGTFLNNQPANKNNNQNTNNAQKDDDNCSVVCFKHLDTGLVGVVRIRQQIFCSICSSMRGTLLLYCKHVLDNTHRDKVKKLCDEKCFIPTIYEQAVHLAFHNNFCYQSDKFHFLYKHSTEEPDSTSPETKLLTVNNGYEPEKMEINSNQSKSTPPNASKQRNIQVTLVFQDKTYTKTGTALAQIREQLLKDMLVDRASDVAALPADIYYTKKNLAPDHAYYNIANSSVILTMADAQSQVTLKQQQELLKNGSMSSAESSREDNGVEQTTAMTTHEVSTAGKADADAQPSADDDVTNVCKDALNSILVDVYSKCDESKREREFLFGIARRRFKKRKAFYCDLCSAFLITEDSCTEHRNGPEHLDKIRRYRTDFPPWRRAMQESLITGKPFKEIMGAAAYDDYKSTMGLYLAPNSVQNHGRFCCAYCAMVFPDQWLLEKHLHTAGHQAKQTSTNHKELVPHFADVIILPNVYKFNGVNDLSEVPNDIKKEHQWSCVTRQELDDDTKSFLQKYPFDQLEATTPLANTKTSRRKRPFHSASSVRRTQVNTAPARGQQSKRGQFNPQGRGQHQGSTAHRGGVAKRSFPATSVSSKRFRPDLNNSYAGANRGAGPARNYQMNQYNYAPPVPFNNGNARWSSPYPSNQQQHRQEHFQQPLFESRSFPSNNNNRSYESTPALMMSGANNYDSERQPRFSNGPAGGYGNQQSAYDPPFNHPPASLMSGYRSEPAPSLLGGPPNHLPQRAGAAAANELMHSNVGNHQRPLLSLPQHPSRPPPNQTQYANPNSFGTFGGNNSNPNNVSFFPPSGNPKSNQAGTNGAPIPSYADYRATSALPAASTSSSMYSSSLNTQNSVASQARPFDNFGRSAFPQAPAPSYGRSSGPSFGMEEQRFGTFGHQNNPVEQSPQAPWRGAPSGVNHIRGRGQARGRGAFQSTNKQPGSTFSYRSNSNGNTTSMRGQGVAHNARNFGSQR